MHQRQKPLLETLALGVLRSTALHGRNPEIPLSLVDSSPALCRDLNTKASWVRHWQSRDTQPGPLGQIQPRVVHFALNVVVRPLQRKKLTEHQDSAQSLASNPTCCVGWNADMLDTCVSSRQSFDGKTDTMFRPAEWC